MKELDRGRDDGARSSGMAACGTDKAKPTPAMTDKPMADDKMAKPMADDKMMAKPMADDKMAKPAGNKM